MTRTLTAAARGLATCAAIVALASACSSSTSGSGSPGTGGGGGGTVGTSGGVSAPPTGGSGGGGGGGGGGGAASGNFCTDWRHVGDDLSKIVDPSGIQQQFVARFDRLAAEAPDAIKPAVVAVDQYVHSAVSGNADPQAAQKLGQDFEQIGVWIAQNCH